MKAMVGVVLIAGLSACAMAPGQPSAGQADPVDVHVDLVRGMLEQQQYYAALAHVEELAIGGRADHAELRLLRAQALYRLDRLSDAERDFSLLIHGAYAGQALHGLGLIYVKSDLARAVRYFNAALRRRPTDPDLRNDLGYALMLAGRLPEARHHLATAAELNPQEIRASNNLIVSYLLEGNESKAGAIARQLGLGSREMIQLRREVGVLRRVIRTRADEFGSNNG